MHVNFFLFDFLALKFPMEMSKSNFKKFFNLHISFRMFDLVSQEDRVNAAMNNHVSLD